MKYSATTVFMPNFTLSEQAGLLAKHGYDGLELRVRRVTDEQRAKAETSNWGYHVNDMTPENFAENAPEILRILEGEGIALAGIASAAPCTDLEQVKSLLEGAVATKAPFIRVGASSGFKPSGEQDYWQIYGETVAGYSRVLELTKGTGVKIVLEIHGNTIHPSAAMAYRIVSNFSPNDVGVIYDPQNMVKDGYETTALALQLLGPYVAHCHLGAHRPLAGEIDENGRTQWKWEQCRLAEGLYDVPTMIQQLKRHDYQGFISIEDFGPRSPEEKLEDAIAYLKSLD